MKLLKYTLIVLFSVGLMSCGSSGGGDDDVDTTPPTLNITSPSASQSVDAGTNLTVSFTAGDNVALKSYTLTVAFSGVKSVKTVEEFSFNSATDTDAEGKALQTISGPSADVSFPMAIADNATPGNYKLTVVVTDEAGNPSEEKSVTFEIK